MRKLIISIADNETEDAFVVTLQWNSSELRHWLRQEGTGTSPEPRPGPAVRLRASVATLAAMPRRTETRRRGQVLISYSGAESGEAEVTCPPAAHLARNSSGLGCLVSVSSLGSQAPAAAFSCSRLFTFPCFSSEITQNVKHNKALSQQHSAPTNESQAKAITLFACHILPYSLIIH